MINLFLINCDGFDYGNINEIKVNKYNGTNISWAGLKFYQTGTLLEILQIMQNNLIALLYFVLLQL